MALPQLKVPAEAMLPDNAQYTNRFEIRSSSSNRIYVIAQNKGNRGWSCGCPGWIFKRGGIRKCKHLKALGLPFALKALEVNVIAVTA